MSQVELSATVTYTCRGAGGRYIAPQSTTVVAIGDDQYPDQYYYSILSQANQDAPAGCVGVSVGPIDVIGVATPGPQETPAGVTTSVRALAWFRCTDSDGQVKNKPFTFLGNFPGNTDIDTILSTIELWALEIESEFQAGFGPEAGDYDVCVYLKRIQIIEPTYWEMSVGI